VLGPGIRVFPEIEFGTVLIEVGAPASRECPHSRQFEELGEFTSVDDFSNNSWLNPIGCG
jgi:hypothetical protein